MVILMIGFQILRLFCVAYGICAAGGETSLAVPPLRLERKGLGNVAYTTCTLWNADLVIRRSLLKSVIIFYNKVLLNFMYD